MLVLTRKSGEGIRIKHDGVTVFLKVEVRGQKIKVSVDAPRKVKVVRAELKDAL